LWNIVAVKSGFDINYMYINSPDGTLLITIKYYAFTHVTNYALQLILAHYNSITHSLSQSLTYLLIVVEL